MFAVDQLRNRKEINYQINKVLAYQRKVKIDLIPDRNWILALVLPKRTVRILDIGPSPFVFDILLESEQRDLYEYHTMDFVANDGQKNNKTIEHVHNANVPGYPFEDGYFDMVIASDVIEHIKETKVFLNEIGRILKPSGELFLTTPNYGSLAGLKRVLFGKMMHNPLGNDLERYCYYDHVRYFTTIDLIPYLKDNKLYPKVLIVPGLVTDRGYPFRPFPWNLLFKYLYNILPRIHYRFAHQTVIIAGKTEMQLQKVYVG